MCYQKWILIFVVTLLFNTASYAGLYGHTYCKKVGFHCVKVKHKQSWRSLWPDVIERDIVMRLNRMNTQLYPGLRIAVPDNLATSSIMDFSPLDQEINPPNEKLIVFDPQVEAWGAYDADGRLVRWGPASGGANWCKDIEEVCHTRSGSFRIYSLGSSECISHKFPLPDGGAPMPFCMYFNSGQAFHGEPNGLPGFNASHGCVRLYVNDAEWLRYDFVEAPNLNNHFRGTKVLVKSYNNADFEEAEGYEDI